MLSYIYQLARQFESSHQIRPNLLYLHPDHLTRLRQSFAFPADLERILGFLQMELIVDHEVVHPHVGWVPTLQRRCG